MVRKSDDSELSGMSAVYCTFGQPEGTGLLALMTTPDVYRFAGRDCHIVYLPTSPVPMTGGILFVPVDDCAIAWICRRKRSCGSTSPSEFWPPRWCPPGNQVKAVQNSGPEDTA